jgi:MFS family permease
MRHYVLTRPFLSLSLQNLLFFSSLNILNVLPDYLAALGAPHSYIGLFMNLGSLALVVLVLPLNRITQRIGRRRVLAISYLVSIGAAAGMFFISTNLALLLPLRALGTLAFCAAFTIHGAEAFELVPRARRIGGIAIFGVSGLLSNPVGTFVGERILAGAHPAGVFAVSGGLLAICLIVALGYRWHQPEPDAASVGLARIALRRELRGLILLSCAMGGGFAIYATFLANLTSEVLGSVRISPFFAAFSLVAIATRVFLANVLDRVHRGALAAVCFAGVSMSYLLSTLLRPGGLWLLVIMGMTYGAGHSTLFPVMTTLFVETGSDAERLELNSIFVSSLTLGGLLLSVGLGLVGDLLGTRTIFAVMAVLAAVASVLAYVAVRPALRATARMGPGGSP